MINVIIDNFIIVIAGICSLVFSDQQSICLMASGALMILVTALYVTSTDLANAGPDAPPSSETETSSERVMRILLVILQGLLVSVLAVFGGSVWGFVAFASLMGYHWGLVVGLGIVDFFLYDLYQMGDFGQMDGQWIARNILNLLIVILLVGLVQLVKYLLNRNSLERVEARHRLTTAAVREFHEHKLNQELLKQNYLNEKNARMVERENISRNIHNSVGHSITAAVMTLDAADMLFDKKPEDSRRRMNDAKERIQGSLEAIRSAVRVLDKEDEKVSMGDMRKFFDDIVTNFVMDTELSLDKLYDIYREDIEIDKEHVEFLTGVLEELLTNGLKHGHATAFRVLVVADSAHIKLTVKDNGTSDFNPENQDALIEKGFGLKKMISYARRVGGSYEFKNEDGFTSVVELPLG